MTEFATPPTFAPIEQAPLDVAPPSPVKSDWSATDPAGTARDIAGKTRQERRGTIEQARAKVEARGASQTKQQRLAGSGSRQVGSEDERRDTRSAVRRAMDKVEGVASDKDFALSRKDREAIRQRHGDVGEFIKRSEQWEAEFKTDPVGTREKILATYAGVSPQNFRDSVEPEKASGARGSIQQAQRDQADLAALRQYESKYGKAFPAIVAQLNSFDKDLIQDPVGVSARLAANYGAPVTETQQRAYEQKQAAERHRQQDAANLHRDIESIIKQVPDLCDEATLNAIADILESKSFKRSGDRLADLGRAHAQVMAGRSAAKQNTRGGAGNKSIHGAPSTSTGPMGRSNPRGNQTPVGAAVSRAFGKS